MYAFDQPNFLYIVVYQYSFPHVQQAFGIL